MLLWELSAASAVPSRVAARSNQKYIESVFVPFFLYPTFASWQCWVVGGRDDYH